MCFDFCLCYGVGICFLISMYVMKLVYVMISVYVTELVHVTISLYVMELVCYDFSVCYKAGICYVLGVFYGVGICYNLSVCCGAGICYDFIVCYWVGTFYYFSACYGVGIWPMIHSSMSSVHWYLYLCSCKYIIHISKFKYDIKRKKVISTTLRGLSSWLLNIGYDHVFKPSY